jgi:glycosyltransferase involved in cell wall biosynthesis
MARAATARVWYVGDEWVSHYSSLVKPGRIGTWGHLKTAAVWGLYERTFASALDRIWVVSDREARHMRRWAATDRVDALPNGVDSVYFAPTGVPERPNTAVFWGRLDFAPNLQALHWFCSEVWPGLRRRCPDAQFSIIGFNAGVEARALAQLPGVSLTPDLSDIRGVVGEHAVAVMPFNSGGGVKNKLLEAASMGKAVVCSPLSCNGLRGEPALVVAPLSGDAWVAAISRLWKDAEGRARLGRQAREWTVGEHSWTRTAEDAVASLRPCLAATTRAKDEPSRMTSRAVPSRPLRLLFVKRELIFPRSYGHDITGYNMMRALAQLGHKIGLLTVVAPTTQAIDGLDLEWRATLGSLPPAASTLTLPGLQAKFASYFGVTKNLMLTVASTASSFEADAIVGVGPDTPPYMVAASIPRIWYVGDEWVSHYASLFSPGQIDTWGYLKTAAVWGVYERTFGRELDRIWVVSDREARQMRRWAGTEQVDAMPNGVDSDYFAPTGVPERPRSAVFWGRLDFAPNQQALQWFCREVWPELHRRYPDAAFSVIGFSPGEDVRTLAQMPGVRLLADLDDVRGAVSEHAVAVMPFHSGGGIKNKLLEAASLGKAVVSSPMACYGLRGEPALAVTPFTGDAWVAAISGLWDDTEGRAALGRRARDWVVAEHSWKRTAEDALRSLCSNVLETSSRDGEASRRVTVNR